MKRILISLSIIAAVAAIVVGATVTQFSDPEQLAGNTLSTGVVDIIVDEHNPWSLSDPFELIDMKPSQTRYIVFTVRNSEDSNPIKLWKHIDITSQEDGAITEPECDEGGGVWDQESTLQCGGSYQERNNLAAYTIYDLHVCHVGLNENVCEVDGDNKPVLGTGWQELIGEDQYIRLDSASSNWILLDQMEPNTEMKVVQSYHLSSWPGAPEPSVTNWAQGDVMTFNIDLYAEQIDGFGPLGAERTVQLDNKNPTSWEPITTDTMSGTLTFDTAAPTFNYSFSATGLQQNTEYSLIYYADPWPGNNPGALIDTMTTDSSGNVSKSNSIPLNIDLPTSPDTNAPAGAKIWLVPSADYSGTSMVAWNPTQYLFDIDLISYDYAP